MISSRTQAASRLLEALSLSFNKLLLENVEMQATLVQQPVSDSCLKLSYNKDTQAPT